MEFTTFLVHNDMDIKFLINSIKSYRSRLTKTQTVSATLVDKVGRNVEYFSPLQISAQVFNMPSEGSAITALAEQVAGKQLRVSGTNDMITAPPKFKE